MTCPASAKNAEMPLSSGARKPPIEQPPSLLDVANRIANALERQTLLLADLLSQNTVILEHLLDHGDQEQEPGTDMEGNPISER